MKMWLRVRVNDDIEGHWPSALYENRYAALNIIIFFSFGGFCFLALLFIWILLLLLWRLHVKLRLTDGNQKKNDVREDCFGEQAAPYVVVTMHFAVDSHICHASQQHEVDSIRNSKLRKLIEIHYLDHSQFPNIKNIFFSWILMEIVHSFLLFAAFLLFILSLYEKYPLQQHVIANWNLWL